MPRFFLTLFDGVSPRFYLAPKRKARFQRHARHKVCREIYVSELASSCSNQCTLNRWKKMDCFPAPQHHVPIKRFIFLSLPKELCGSTSYWKFPTLWFSILATTTFCAYKWVRSKLRNERQGCSTADFIAYPKYLS